MPITACIKGTILETKFKNKISEGISEYQAISQILVESYNSLNDKLNSIKENINLQKQSLIASSPNAGEKLKQFDLELEEVRNREYPIPQTFEEEVKITNLKSSTINVENTSGFNGDFNYLTTEFVSDFYIKMLKEREKNSEIYKNFYSNFDVNEKGIYLKNDDSITMSQIKEYAEEDLKQYSIISKQMPLLIEQEIQESTKQVRRDNIINNPQKLNRYNGQFHKLNENNIILQNSEEEFVKVGGEIYEAIDSYNNLVLYSRLESNVGEYYNLNNEAPKTNIKIEEYVYLSNSPEKFISDKKYLSKKDKEKINQENFDCN